MGRGSGDNQTTAVAARHAEIAATELAQDLLFALKDLEELEPYFAAVLREERPDGAPEGVTWEQFFEGLQKSLDERWSDESLDVFSNDLTGRDFQARFEEALFLISDYMKAGKASVRERVERALALFSELEEVDPQKANELLDTPIQHRNPMQAFAKSSLTYRQAMDALRKVDDETWEKVEQDESGLVEVFVAGEAMVMIRDLRLYIKQARERQMVGV